MKRATDLRVAGVTLALGLAVVGCGYVVSRSISLGCPGALLEGLLVERDGELVVTSPDGEHASKVKWPFGWSLRRDGDTLVVTDLLGDVKAREGDGIRVGGGMVDDERFGVCGDVLVTVGATP